MKYSEYNYFCGSTNGVFLFLHLVTIFSFYNCFYALDKLLYDVLFVDIAGSMNVEGLNCPPPSFITAEVLTSMHNLLKPNGWSFIFLSHLQFSLFFFFITSLPNFSKFDVLL